MAQPMNFFPVRFDRSHDKVRPIKAASSPPLHVRSGDHEKPLSMMVDQGRVVLSLQESHLDHWQSREELGQRLCQILDDPKVRVLRIDMTDVAWLDGDALAQFARIHCKASQLGKQIILENVSDAVREIFHLTRFDRVVGLVDDRGVRNVAGWAAETAPFT
jgi:anti-anti-sigma factor